MLRDDCRSRLVWLTNFKCGGERQVTRRTPMSVSQTMNFVTDRVHLHLDLLAVADTILVTSLLVGSFTLGPTARSTGGRERSTIQPEAAVADSRRPHFHHGADDGAVGAEGSCGLVQTRSSISDITVSRRPIVEADGHAHLVFNGEHLVCNGEILTYANRGGGCVIRPARMATRKC